MDERYLKIEIKDKNLKVDTVLYPGTVVYPEGEDIIFEEIVKGISEDIKVESKKKRGLPYMSIEEQRPVGSGGPIESLAEFFKDEKVKMCWDLLGYLLNSVEAYELFEKVKKYFVNKLLYTHGKENTSIEWGEDFKIISMVEDLKRKKPGARIERVFQNDHTVIFRVFETDNVYIFYLYNLESIDPSNEEPIDVVTFR